MPWKTFGANASRRVGPARRMLTEPQSGNGVRNPYGLGGTPGVIRDEAGAAGSGVPPTYWNLIQIASYGSGGANGAVTVTGLVVHFHGTGQEDGLNYAEVSVVGTPSESGDLHLLFDNRTLANGGGTAVPAACALFVRAVGPIAGVLRAGIVRWTPSGALSNGTNAARVTIAPADAPLGGQRFSVAIGAGSGSGDRCSASVIVQMTAGVAINARFRVAAPQLEVGAAFPSAPILPPGGSLGSATRAADSAVIARTAFGGDTAFPASFQSTIVASFFTDRAGPSDLDRVVVQYDDGTDANAYEIVIPAGTTNLVARRVTAGVVADAVLGAVTADAFHRVAAAINDSGRIAASLNGAAIAAATGGPTTGATHMRAGNSQALNAGLFADLTGVWALPYAATDADLPGLALTAPF